MREFIHYRKRSSDRNGTTRVSDSDRNGTKRVEKKNATGGWCNSSTIMDAASTLCNLSDPSKLLVKEQMKYFDVPLRNN